MNIEYEGGTDMIYGKIFKKIINGKSSFKLVPYETVNTSYSKLIKDQKENGYRQVLFNVQLMLRLMTCLDEYPKFYLKSIKMCTDAEVDIQNSIDDLVIKSRSNSSLVHKIVSELEWYSDEESIDIANIEFGKKDSITSSMNMQTNGIVFGENIQNIFDELISPQLLRYFNEE